MQIGVRNTRCRKRTVGARTPSISALGTAVCMHGIRRVLRVTKPLDVLHEVNTRCGAGMAVKSFPPLTG